MVRFAEDQSVVHQQRRQSYQAKPHMDSIAGDAVQDMRTTSKRRDSKAETYPQMPTIVKKEFEDDSSESSSEELPQETPPAPDVFLSYRGNIRKYPELHHAIDTELNNYFEILEKDSFFPQIESSKYENGVHEGNRLKNRENSNVNSSSSSLKNDNDSKKVMDTLEGISNDLDAYLNELESHNLYASPDLSSEQKHDAISDIHLRRMTEKNV